MSSDPRSLSHRRTHNLLLIQKILAFRSAETSPFTLVLDSVEQGAGGLVREVVRGAKASKIHIVYVSYTTHVPPPNTDVFIKARRKTPEAVKQEIASACSSTKKNLLILSPITPLLTHHLNGLLNLPTYLLSLISPTTSLLAVHHHDILLPLPTPITSTPSPSSTSSSFHASSYYAPAPALLLTYLATTILTLSSFPQSLARKRARDRSAREPAFGLAEGREGVVVGMGGNAFLARGSKGGKGGGLVLAMEHRRKSGRAVREVFFVPPPSNPSSSAPPPSTPSSSSSSSQLRPQSPSSRPSTTNTNTSTSDALRQIILLDDHPLFLLPPHQQTLPRSHAGEKADEEATVTAADLGGTFNLRLTPKQREAREGVVLPYYDAQHRRDFRGGGPGGGAGGSGGERAGASRGMGEAGEGEGQGGDGKGEGGRILYDMGAEDDFDEEEDEI